MIELTFDRKVLLSAVRPLIEATVKSDKAPQFGMFLVTVSEALAERVVMMASNGFLLATARVPAVEKKGEGQFMLEAEVLKGILSSYNDQDVKMIFDGAKTTVKIGNAIFPFSTMDPVQFLQGDLDRSTLKKVGSIDASNLYALLERASRFMSRKEGVVERAQVILNGKKAVAISDFGTYEEGIEGIELRVPAVCVDELIKFLGEAGQAEIEVLSNEGTYLLDLPEKQLTWMFRDPIRRDFFVEYDAIRKMQEGETKTIKVEREWLETVVRRVTIPRDQEERIKISVVPTDQGVGVVKVEFQTKRGSISHEYLKCIYSGSETLEKVVNVDYILAVMKVLEKSVVELGFGARILQVHESVEDERTKSIVLPVYDSILVAAKARPKKEKRPPREKKVKTEEKKEEKVESKVGGDESFNQLLSDLKFK